MKFRFKLIHLEAIVIYLVYTLGAKLLFFRNIIAKNGPLAWLYQSAFTLFFAIFFLYIFDHEGFFPFASPIEKKERSQEKKMEKKYLHFGKALVVIIIEVLSGPILGALATHFLFRRHRKLRYFLLGVVAILTGPLLLILVRGGIFYLH